MSTIPKKDVNLIIDVAEYVARTNSVATFTEDDLKQEMIIYGMKSYSKWDESQHIHKNESKRDKNLRLFLKDYMIKRLKNMWKAVERNKRAVNVNVISFDQNDPAYESLLIDNETRQVTEDNFEGLGLSSEEKSVLAYIANNGLGKGGVKKKDIVEELGVESSKITSIIKDLGDNDVLRDYLENQILTT